MKIIQKQKFGRLKILKRVADRITPNGTPFPMVLCYCSCGTEKVCNLYNITNGRTKSCGCLNKEKLIARRKHGMIHTSIYKSWAHMKGRCLNKSDRAFKDYGERGIKVCDEWMDFQRFFKDMGEAYKEGLSIERIDNNGDYTPDNCKWATTFEQANNRRSVKKFLYKGEQKTLSEWAKILNFDNKFLYNRIFQLNWSIEKAFETPKILSNCNKGV